MKAKYDISITFEGNGGEVLTESFSKVIFDYIDNGHYFFVQEEDDKQDEAAFTNKIHWYPTNRIIKIDGAITRTFETKAERLEYYKAKKGIPAKGNAIKN